MTYIFFDDTPDTTPTLVCIIFHAYWYLLTTFKIRKGEEVMYLEEKGRRPTCNSP